MVVVVIVIVVIVVIVVVIVIVVIVLIAVVIVVVVVEVVVVVGGGVILVVALTITQVPKYINKEPQHVHFHPRLPNESILKKYLQSLDCPVILSPNFSVLEHWPH